MILFLRQEAPHPQYTELVQVLHISVLSFLDHYYSEFIENELPPIC